MILVWSFKSPKRRYSELMTKASSAATADTQGSRELAEIGTNMNAYKIYLEAAELARKHGLEPSSETFAARMAYGCALNAGELAVSLGEFDKARTAFSSALNASTAHHLDRHYIEEAVVKSRNVELNFQKELRRK